MVISKDPYQPGPDGIVRLTRQQIDHLVKNGWKEGETDFSNDITPFTKKQGRKVTDMRVKITYGSPVKSQPQSKAMRSSNISDTGLSQMNTFQNTPMVPKVGHGQKEN